MDLAGKVVMGMLVVWAGAIIVGLIIALVPVLLFVVGFFLMLGLLTLLAKLFGSWFLY